MTAGTIPGMKRMLPIGLVLLALAGCAPSTSAHDKCVTYLVDGFKQSSPSATQSEIDAITDASDRGCRKDEAKDPAAFEELWGD